MNALLEFDPEDYLDNPEPILVREARDIVSGKSRKMATTDHLRALLAQLDGWDTVAVGYTNEF
jgi:hypothetical protein